MRSRATEGQDPKPLSVGFGDIAQMSAPDAGAFQVVLFLEQKIEALTLPIFHESEGCTIKKVLADFFNFHPNLRHPDLSGKGTRG